jgi:hypothetical protein
MGSQVSQTLPFKICKKFIIPLYKLLLCAQRLSCHRNQCYSWEDRILVHVENGTYIRVYGATKYPHLFPRFVPDKVVLQEVAYQTLLNGVGGALTRDNKLTYPPMPF